MRHYQHPEWYLPHAAPMVLLDEVITVEEERAHCRVAVSAESVLAPYLNAEGALPAWFGIELLAQTIGVWSGWHGRQSHDAKPAAGMLLGARGYRCPLPAFPAGAQLDIEVTLLMRDDRLGSFEGTLQHQGEILARGRVNTWQPQQDELQQLLTRDNNG